jgi:hypothetical protein
MLTVTIMFVLGSLLIGGLSPKALASEDLNTQIATGVNYNNCFSVLNGNYIYGFQGFTLFAPPPTGIPFDQISAYVPFSISGTVTFDGQGQLTSVDFANLGAGGFLRTGAGTYVVDKTVPGYCAYGVTWTFTSTAFGLPPITDHMYMVPGLDGKSVAWVVTDAGTISSGILYKQ